MLISDAGDSGINEYLSMDPFTVHVAANQTANAKVQVHAAVNTPPGPIAEYGLFYQATSTIYGNIEVQNGQALEAQASMYLQAAVLGKNLTLTVGVNSADEPPSLTPPSNSDATLVIRCPTGSVVTEAFGFQLVDSPGFILYAPTEPVPVNSNTYTDGEPEYTYVPIKLGLDAHADLKNKNFTIQTTIYDNQILKATGTAVINPATKTFETDFDLGGTDVTGHAVVTIDSEGHWYVMLRDLKDHSATFTPSGHVYYFALSLGVWFNFVYAGNIAKNDEGPLGPWGDQKDTVKQQWPEIFKSELTCQGDASKNWGLVGSKINDFIATVKDWVDDANAIAQAAEEAG